MKSHARVVVVGGGVFGASILYHLAKEGWTDVVLVEKGELTSGTTWHAAGLCPSFIGSLGFANIHTYGINLYKTIEAETGHPTGWHTTGSIRLARDKEELDWHRWTAGLANQVGFEQHILGPDEIKELHPYVDLAGVVGGAHTPDDGYVDPSEATNSMAQGARQNGAEIYRHTRVTDLKPRDGGGWQVITEKGNITCEHLVLATGFFTPQVGAWLGLKIPTANMVHQYLITETVKELEARDSELPVIRDPWSCSYVRQELNGLLGGPYENKGIRSVHHDGVPWTFDHDLLDADLDHIAPWLEMMVERMPLFGSVGIRKVISGFIAHTPDLSPLVGPAPGLQNVWLACGAAIGIAQGPGCGKYLAQWMVHGAADISMLALDPRRFGDFHMGDYTLKRTHEATEHLYDLHPPGHYFKEGRPLRTSPIYEELGRHGAVNAEAFGWERPNWFAPEGVEEKYSYSRNNSFEYVAEECRAVRERVGVLDLTSFAKFEVAGRDAETLLNRLYANRMPAKAGGITLAHQLTDGGLIESEATITRLGADRFYILAAGSAQIRDFDMLNHGRLPGEQVTISDVSDDFGCLLVTGPRAREVLAGLTSADLSSAAFPWLSAAEIDVAGVPVRALRVSYAGELGWELHAATAETTGLYKALMEAGAEFGIANFGFYALNSLRMEKAYRGFGAELMNEMTPIEADIERFVDYDQGDFVGHGALLQRKQDGVAWKLAYLSLAAPDLDILGSEPVYTDGKIVGVITSGGYGHTVGQNLAFAYVPPALAAPGTALQVEMLGNLVEAEVQATAIYDSRNERLRA
jgi:dimethylglycine dehydrogenase